MPASVSMRSSTSKRRFRGGIIRRTVQTACAARVKCSSTQSVSANFWEKCVTVLSFRTVHLLPARSLMKNRRSFRISSVTTDISQRCSISMRPSSAAVRRAGMTRLQSPRMTTAAAASPARKRSAISACSPISSKIMMNRAAFPAISRRVNVLSPPKNCLPQ